MSAVKLPLDLTQIHPFRELKAALGGVGAAHSAWWELWRELGYWAQEGNLIGRLPGEALAGFQNALTDQGLPGEGTLASMVACKLLAPEADGYYCARFALLNRDLSGAKREAVGGNMKKFYGDQKRLGGRVVQQVLSISGTKFVDKDGNPLSSEETEKVTRLIISCDNALFKGERPSPGFTEALIQDALVVSRQLTDDEIDCILRAVALKRAHPFLAGMTAERLLPQFRDMILKLA